MQPDCSVFILIKCKLNLQTLSKEYFHLDTTVHVPIVKILYSLPSLSFPSLSLILFPSLPFLLILCVNCIKRESNGELLLSLTYKPCSGTLHGIVLKANNLRRKNITGTAGWLWQSYCKKHTVKLYVDIIPTHHGTPT